MFDGKLPKMEEVDAEMAKRNLLFMAKKTWRYIEPKLFMNNWHIECIADHLEAVKRGEISRLLINIPPRHMKSLLSSVFFPAWVWLSEPGTSFLFASYAQSLSIRDSIKCRRIIQNPIYENFVKHCQPDFKLVDDQNTKIKFENNQGGYRVATSVGGALTGEGADIIVIDDPHNVVEGESEIVRNMTIQWWDESMSTRLNNPRTGAYIIIMQRVHEGDLTGHVLAKNHKDWNHVCIPAEYEGENRIISSLGWKDPRKKENELLWERRVGRKEMEEVKSALGEYASAGQLQQRPSPRKGGMFKPHQMEIVDLPPEKIVKTVRYWDKAGSKNKGAFTAGVKVGKMTDGRFIVLDVIRGQWEALEREKIMKQTAKLDGFNTRIRIEQEPGSGGKESAQATIRNLAGHIIEAEKPTGDKEARAEPFAIQVNAGNVLLLKADWNKVYVEELKKFPAGKYKDQVDASSGAFNQLHSKKKVIVA